MSGTFDPDVTVDYGMVQDGTKCGQEMICMNQTCVNTAQFKSYTRCPVDATNVECSGRGVSIFGHFSCIKGCIRMPKYLLKSIRGDQQKMVVPFLHVLLIDHFALQLLNQCDFPYITISQY